MNCLGLLANTTVIDAFFARASSMSMLPGASSRIRRSGDGIMPLRSYTRTSTLIHTRLLDGWYAASSTQIKPILTGAVPPMDRPSRPPRNPHLRLPNPRPEHQKHGRLQRNNEHLQPPHRGPAIIHRPRASPPSLRAVREPAAFRDARVLEHGAAE